MPGLLHHLRAQGQQLLPALLGGLGNFALVPAQVAEAGGLQVMAKNFSQAGQRAPAGGSSFGGGGAY